MADFTNNKELDFDNSIEEEVSEAEKFENNFVIRGIKCKFRSMTTADALRTMGMTYCIDGHSGAKVAADAWEILGTTALKYLMYFDEDIEEYKRLKDTGALVEVFGDNDLELIGEIMGYFNKFLTRPLK